ncbi:hypothetical protein Ahy_A02g005739 isoform E [Arachis hypogaea]|uniref:dihydroneopterin aldolase n=1 Tax=Arachis hypogaea TaxID=3818 RepID=A0A445E7U6_ARAHY|nr:hypothetical protein Ahy_A02g005739 isoform E [Arachis hypogaea]
MQTTTMETETLMRGDKLILRGVMFHGFHGVNPEERTLGQKFLVDIDAWMDLRAAGKSDNLSDSVSYTDIYRSKVGTCIDHMVLDMNS